MIQQINTIPGPAAAAAAAQKHISFTSMCCSFFFYYCIMCSQQKLLLKRNINYKDLVSLSRINIMINPNIHTYCYSRVRIQKIFSFSLLFYQGSLLISSRPNQGHSCVYF